MSSQDKSSRPPSTNTTERRRKEEQDKYEAAEALVQLSNQRSSGTAPAAAPEIPKAVYRIPDPVQGEGPSSVAGPSKAEIAPHALSRKRPASEVGDIEESQLKKRRYDICRKCTRTFNTKREAKEHLQSCDKRYKCDYCDYETPYHSYNECHKERHAETQCSACVRNFSTRQALQMHIQSQHTSQSQSQSFTCDKCQKSYSLIRNLQRHIREKHTPATEQFVCVHCSLIFSSKKGLEIHQARKHPGRARETFRCEICGKEFSRNTNRLRHMREVHHM